MTNTQKEQQNITIETLPPLFDTKTLVVALGLTVAWAERSRWKGKGPKFVRVGRAVRYKREDVLEWLEQRTCSSTLSISK